MSKPNAEQTEQEFRYTFACKMMLHDIAYVMEDLEKAKAAGLQGVSKGALSTVELRIYDLKAALYNALKTV